MSGLELAQKINQYFKPFGMVSQSTLDPSVLQTLRHRFPKHHQYFNGSLTMDIS
jgi:hypothetical protein